MSAAGIAAGISQPTGDEVVDELDDSPVPRQVLGEAYQVMVAFHRKLVRDGVDRGVIGPHDRTIVWERHILNSAAVLPFVVDAVKDTGVKTIADIGSGGGFPGIIIAACLPEYAVTLVEPMQRRVDWLREVVDELKLSNVTIVRARSEQLLEGGNRHAGLRARARAQRRGAQGYDVSDKVSGKNGLGNSSHHYGVVTCRAVAPMTKLSGWTLPLLVPHGRLVALKGRSAQAELDKAGAVIRRWRGVHPRVEVAAVGPGLEPTHVVLVDRR